MGKIIFISGGARSGKSNMAIELAKQNGRRAAFVATCQPLDKEMRRRIELHKKSRPGHWQTFEEPLELPALMKRIGAKFDVIIIDCLTLLVSNLFLSGIKAEGIEKNISRLCGAIKKIRASAIIISNEVGMGIVPDNALSREFRDIAGRVNQIVAEESDAVFAMFSGIPLKIK